MENHNKPISETVAESSRAILQVIVSEWPEYNIMNGKERNTLFDGIKPILTEILTTQQTAHEDFTKEHKQSTIE